MKNRKVIKALKKERRKLYPYGYPTYSRGCVKCSLRMANFLKYAAYDVVCNRYKNMDREVSLEEAHKDMEDFINEMWALKEDF